MLTLLVWLIVSTFFIPSSKIAFKLGVKSVSLTSISVLPLVWLICFKSPSLSIEPAATIKLKSCLDFSACSSAVKELSISLPKAL